MCTFKNDLLLEKKTWKSNKIYLISIDRHYDWLNWLIGSNIAQHMDRKTNNKMCRHGSIQTEVASVGPAVQSSRTCTHSLHYLQNKGVKCEASVSRVVWIAVNKLWHSPPSHPPSGEDVYCVLCHNLQLLAQHFHYVAQTLIRACCAEGPPLPPPPTSHSSFPWDLYQPASPLCEAGGSRFSST